MMRIVERIQIEQQILEGAGQFVVVEESDGVLALTGVVDSAEASQAAEDIAAAAAPNLRIENDLEVATELPVDVADFQSAEASAEMVEDAAQLTADGQLEADFTDLPLQVSPIEGEAEGEPTFAPTDPVISVDHHGRVHVLGGFSPDSMASLEVEPSSLDTRPGDEALAEAVRRELREDASTTALAINVFVRRGVAHLRGWVPGFEDIDNAEGVAERVPGVAEVVDELELPTT